MRSVTGSATRTDAPLQAMDCSTSGWGTTASGAEDTVASTVRSTNCSVPVVSPEAWRTRAAHGTSVVSAVSGTEAGRPSAASDSGASPPPESSSTACRSALWPDQARATTPSVSGDQAVTGLPDHTRPRTPNTAGVIVNGAVCAVWSVVRTTKVNAVVVSPEA